MSWDTLMGRVGRRQMKYGTNTVVLSLVVLGILGTVNYLVARNNKRWDLTGNQRFSLAPQTKKVLAALEEDATITYFQRETESSLVARDRLKEYQGASSRVNVAYVDPWKSPAKARQYDITTLPSLVVEYRGKRERISNDSEQDITNAFIKVTREGAKTVCFVEGEGERDPDESGDQGYSAATAALERSQYETRKVFLLREKAVPSDCAVLVVAGPEKDLLGPAVDALREFVGAGGKLLVLIEPGFDGPLPNLEALLGEWNVERGFDVVVDVLAKLPFLSPWFQRIPCLGMVHHLFGTTAFQQVPFPVALVTYLSEKLIPPCYRRSPVVVVSPSTEQDMIERGLPQSNMSIIPNAVDHDRYSPGTEAKPDVPTVAWLGRVEPYKRVDILLRALVQVRKTVPDVRTFIMGEGAGLEAAHALAVQLGIEDSVEFCGFVEIDRKVELLRRAHMLVNTSEKEGWGLTVLEGNACGTITVASDVPGLRDSVRDGITGVLVEHGNVEQLASEMVRLLEDRDTLAALGANAVAWADRFRWDAVTDDMEKVLDAVAAGTDPSDIRMISPVFRN